MPTTLCSGQLAQKAPRRRRSAARTNLGPAARACCRGRIESPRVVTRADGSAISTTQGGCSAGVAAVQTEFRPRKRQGTPGSALQDLLRAVFLLDGVRASGSPRLLCGGHGGQSSRLGGVDVIQERLLIPDGVLQLEFCASHTRRSQNLHGGNVAFSGGDTDPGCREVRDRFSCIPPP